MLRRLGFGMLLVLASTVGAQTSIYDFYIAYLVDSFALSAENPVSGESVSDALGAYTFDYWDDFLTQNDEQPFDVVLIHNSMVEWVDPDWISEAYRDGVSFIGVDMPLSTLAGLVDDACIHTPARESLENSYTLLVYQPYFTDEDRRNTVNQANLEDCSTRNLKGVERIAPRKGALQGTVNSAEDWEYFSMVLVLALSD